MSIRLFLCTLLSLLSSFFIVETALASPPNEDFPITGFANDAGIRAFEPSLIQLMKKWRVPGASLVVMKNGQIVVDKGYGWEDKKTGKTISADSLFRIASTSKTVTATTVLKLAQMGKLNLNDSVFRILSDLRPLNGRPINPQINRITVKNLLQMSSGWFSGGGGHFDPMFGPWILPMKQVLGPTLPASCEMSVRFMMSQPLKYAPGTHYAYANMDYCLLGLVINKVTGSSYGYSGYESYVKKTVLYPLGITDMQIGSTEPKYRLHDEVTYYEDLTEGRQELANSWYLPYSNTELLRKNFANGGWLATSKDLATLVQALSAGRILNPSFLSIMQQKPSFVPKSKQAYYTMGGIIDYLNGQRYWIQTGSFTGSNALIVTKPNGTTIAVVFNYRPEVSSFLSRFRPVLKRMMMMNTF